jgi:2-octaprenyl-6-methoxyphenol hydroxylase
MTKIRADVSIIGGGLVGLSQAIALAQEGLSVHVVERTPYDMQHQAEFDGRASAVAWTSATLLKNTGVWKFLEKEAEPILAIHVQDENSPAIVHFDAMKDAQHPFGFMIENRYIRHALYQRASELPSITIHAPSEADSITVQEHKTTVVLNTKKTIEAPLLLSAEGRKSKLREQMKIDTIHSSYNQTAIVCTIKHDLPHHGIAQELFLPIGPFAILPMTQNRCCLVWTESDNTAPMYLSLSDVEFKHEIAKRLGTSLGDFTLQGKPFSYPLTLLQAKRYIDKRFALVGDSAHGIHPIAGQGVNVGFRDVAALTELILETIRLGLDIGSTTMLERYQQWRRFDGVSMMMATDGLNRLFSNNILPIKLARRTGLAVVNAIPPLKKAFTNHAMGLSGELPKLLQSA